MENTNGKKATTTKEVFTEPICELVRFSFENILASDLSNPIIGPEDPFDS